MLQLAVKEEHRGKGFGKALMLSMQQQCDEAKPQLLPKMHAQLQALPFYQSQGWQRCGDEFDEAGIPHVTMIRPPSDTKNLNALSSDSVPVYIQDLLVKS